MDYDPAGITLVCGPLYHGAPNSWGLQALHHGHTVVLMDKWDNHEFLRLVEEYGVTTAQLAPIHFRRLLSLPAEERRRFDTGSLLVVSHAGAATSVDDKRRMMEWLGPVLWEYYASSEGFGTSISPHDWLEHPGSVGRVDGNGADMKVVDDEGNTLASGEVGTLWIRNPGGLTTTYFGAVADRPMTDEDGFYTAGDMAFVDDEGWLFIVDRRVDLILSGGVNIYPAEVEVALADHPEVADVAVVAAPDQEWGQRVHAVVVPRSPVDDPDAFTAGLLDHARTKLGRFKVPRSVELRSELPYSPTGKLLRRVLRDELWSDTVVPR
jgi:long-chain acyl-CoA synthetase